MNAPPPDIAALLRGYTAHPVTAGASGAGVLRYVRAGERPLFLKTAALDGGRADGGPLGDEAVRLRWMAARGVPVPAVRGYAVSTDREYLVTDEVPGADASVVAAGAPGGAGAALARAVVCALADALRRLHATDAADCPFRHPARARVGEARERARRGLVDAADFDEERRGRRPEALLAELDALSPEAEDARLTHGDYCLPNVVLRVPRLGAAGSVVPPGASDASRVDAPAESGYVVSGLIDCGRAGLADPYQDLALAARSIRSNLGPPWVPAFFTRYGVARVDERKLHFYTLLDEFF